MSPGFRFEHLMQACPDRSDLVACVMAGTLDAAARGLITPPSPTLGLDAHSFLALLRRHFPALGDAAVVSDCNGCRPLRSEEFDDLVSLLIEHRSHDGEEVEWLAHALASACMGGNHLYQDMGLPSRTLLSDLIRIHFTRLFEKNVGNMKWKKFFYKQLCERAEVRLCQAPTCQACKDYHDCFGPE